MRFVAAFDSDVLVDQRAYLRWHWINCSLIQILFLIENH